MVLELLRSGAPRQAAAILAAFGVMFEPTAPWQRRADESPVPPRHPNDQIRPRIFARDLEEVGLLGCGGFAYISLVEHRETGEVYAAKVASKGYIVKTGMQASIYSERNTWMACDSPFIIRLWETFNFSQSICFLSDAAHGGELYSTYNRKGFHGSLAHARFYAAGATCALEHLHARRIVYRDTKPENILLDLEGRTKLCDFGLSKFIVNMTWTTCGTPDYFPPELIASTGHGFAVDWWGLGILIFELLAGHPPFESAYPMQIYSKVMKGINKVPFPRNCELAEAFIKALVRKEPAARLAMQPGGAANVRRHPWYEDFDWAGLAAQTLEPPYKPVVKSERDMANFSARKEDMPRQIEYVDDGTSWDKGFATSPPEDYSSAEDAAWPSLEGLFTSTFAKTSVSEDGAAKDEDNSIACPTPPEENGTAAAERAESEHKECPNCGCVFPKEIVSWVRFCPLCGSRQGVAVGPVGAAQEESTPLLPSTMAL